MVIKIFRREFPFKSLKAFMATYDCIEPVMSIKTNGFENEWHNFPVPTRILYGRQFKINGWTSDVLLNHR